MTSEIPTMLVKGIEDTWAKMHAPAHMLNTKTKPSAIQEQYNPHTAAYEAVHEPHWI